MERKAVIGADGGLHSLLRALGLPIDGVFRIDITILPDRPVKAVVHCFVDGSDLEKARREVEERSFIMVEQKEEERDPEQGYESEHP